MTGCGEGDFGRVRSSLVTDDMHAWVGAAAVASVGGVPSLYELTDDERELRDRAYPLIQPPYDRQRWYSVLSEYGLTGLVYPPFDMSAYSRALMARPARSVSSRYGLLVEDVRNDIVRIEPFFRVGARVADMDSKRAQSLPYVLGLTQGEYANAVSRIAENGITIEWVKQSLGLRIASYRFALERLVIASPSPMAVECEQNINRLAFLVAETRVAAVAPPPRRAAISK